MKTSAKRVESPLSPSVSTKRHGDFGEGRSTPSTTPAHVWQRVTGRTNRLEALGYANYRAYLRSEHWIAVRTRYRASALPQNCICGEDDVHLHHTTYERIGAERLSDLTPLCRRCHALVHVLEWRGEIGLDLEGLTLDEERAAAGRAFLAELIAARQHELEQALRDEQSHVRGLPFATRLLRAVRFAKTQHRDVTRQVWMLQKMVQSGVSSRVLTRRLRMIEEIAYAWEGWSEP